MQKNSIRPTSKNICFRFAAGKIFFQSEPASTLTIYFSCLNSYGLMLNIISTPFPLDTGRKLNVHQTFRRRPGRLLNVLCTFNLRPVSRGFAVVIWFFTFIWIRLLTITFSSLYKYATLITYYESSTSFIRSFIRHFGFIMYAGNEWVYTSKIIIEGCSVNFNS